MDIGDAKFGDDAETSAERRADVAAIDLIKQLITLAAGVLALSATFLEKIAPFPTFLLLILAASWLSLIFSILGGLQTLSVIVKSRLNSDDSWSKGTGKRCAQISKFAFITGITLFALFALILLAKDKPKEVPTKAPTSSLIRAPFSSVQPCSRDWFPESEIDSGRTAPPLFAIHSNFE
jgi:hypothetical protein